MKKLFIERLLEKYSNSIKVAHITKKPSNYKAKEKTGKVMSKKDNRVGDITDIFYGGFVGIHFEGDKENIATFCHKSTLKFI